MNSSKVILNQRGYSLTEIMVVLGIISITGLGTMAMMTNVVRTNETLNTKVALSTLKSRIERNLLSKEAWRETIYHASNNANLGCLRIDSSTDCTDTNGTPLRQINWRNRGPTDLEDFGPNAQHDSNLDGTVFFNDSNNASGFTLAGELCNSFVPSPGAGNDACPIGVDILVELRCRGAVTRCQRPQITAFVDFDFNPATDTSVVNRIDNNRFDTTLDLSEELKHEVIEIKHISADGTQNGGGACTPENTWRVRPLNREIIDSGRNSNTDFPNNQFTLRAGVYNCTVQAEIYSAYRGSAFRLRDTTNGINYDIGIGQGGRGQSVMVSGSAELRSNADFTVQLQTRCFTPSQGQFDMGIPKPNYNQPPNEGWGSNTFTLIRCVRLN